MEDLKLANIMKTNHILILPITIILFITSCSQQPKQKGTVATIPKPDSLPTAPTDSGKLIDIGFYDTFEKLPQLKLQIISESAYIKSTYTTSIQTIKSEQDKDFFYLTTAFKKHSFKKYRDNGGALSWSGCELSGYYPEFKLYAITQYSTADNLGFSELFLLDSITNYTYNIISPGDDRVELPVISPNKRWMAYFHNAAYEPNVCNIFILSIGNKTTPEKFLREHSSYHSNEFTIEEMAWQSDNCILIKVSRELEQNAEIIKVYEYYKTVLY